MLNKFCTHYASTYSKAGTPTSATSCVHDSPPPCRNGPQHHSLCQLNGTFHSRPSFAQDIALQTYPCPFSHRPSFCAACPTQPAVNQGCGSLTTFDFVIVQPNNVAKVSHPMLPDNVFLCPHFQRLYLCRRRSSRAIRLGCPDHSALLDQWSIVSPMYAESIVTQCPFPLNASRKIFNSVTNFCVVTVSLHFTTECESMEFVADKVALQHAQ
jgi:hypothetical protein